MCRRGFSHRLKAKDGDEWTCHIAATHLPKEKRKGKKKDISSFETPSMQQGFAPTFCFIPLFYPSSLTPRHLSRPFWHLSSPKRRKRVETTAHRPKIYYYSARPGMVDPQIRIRQTRAMSSGPVSPYMFPTFPLGKGKGKCNRTPLPWYRISKSNARLRVTRKNHCI